MIPNFLDSLPQLTPSSVQSSKTGEISVPQRIFENISSAKPHWYYLYGLIIMPLVVTSLLFVKEELSRKNLAIYHQEYNDLNERKNTEKSEIDALESFIDKFSNLAIDSIHYHILEKRIFETKRQSLYFTEIKLGPENSFFVVKSSSFLDSAIFLRDLKKYDGASLPLYSPEYWKKDSDGFSESNSEFEMKINFSLKKSNVKDLANAYKSLFNDQMYYKLSLLIGE